MKINPRHMGINPYFCSLTLIITAQPLWSYEAIAIKIANEENT